MDVVVISFSFLVGVIGIVGLMASRNKSEDGQSGYFLGNRKFGPWLTALSASASAESGWVTVGLVGFAFTSGVSAFWVVPGTVLAFAINWFVLAPRINKASGNEVMTIPGLLTHRFEQSRVTTAIRIVGGLIIVVMLTAYVSAQFNAAGKMMEGAFGIPHSTGVLIGAGLVVMYTFHGGFKAIVWTDVVQSLLMILALSIVPILLIVDLGGFSSVFGKLKDMDPEGRLVSLSGGREGWALFTFLGLWLGIPMGNFGQPHVIVRFMAARDDSALQRAGWISCVWVTFLFCSAILLGLCARAWFESLDDPEKVLPQLAAMSDFIPPIIGGLILGAIFSAICSTTDSQLLVASSAVSRDVLQKSIGINFSPDLILLIARVSLVLLTLVAAGYAAAKVQSIFKFVLDYGWAGLGSAFGPALIFVFCWKKTTAIGVLMAMLGGVLTVVIWKQIPALDSKLYSLIPAILIASICLVSISAFFGEKKPTKLK